jgi:alpha-tubulin suppressor-like RCC1 family protein
MVACGDYHTLCLLENGKAIKLSKGRIYTWGGTLHKKLGKNTGGKPGLIQSLEQKNIIYVGCGDFHSAALTDNGELYTWGGGGKFLNRG